MIANTFNYPLRDGLEVDVIEIRRLGKWVEQNRRQDTFHCSRVTKRKQNGPVPQIFWSSPDSYPTVLFLCSLPRLPFFWTRHPLWNSKRIDYALAPPVVRLIDWSSGGCPLLREDRYLLPPLSFLLPIFYYPFSPFLVHLLASSSREEGENLDNIPYQLSTSPKGIVMLNSDLESSCSDKRFLKVRVSGRNTSHELLWSLKLNSFPNSIWVDLDFRSPPTNWIVDPFPLRFPFRIRTVPASSSRAFHRPSPEHSPSLRQLFPSSVCVSRFRTLSPYHCFHPVSFVFLWCLYIICPRPWALSHPFK